MKMKNIMLVALFLLAILTIGAVSATDYATSDNLTAGEIQDTMGLDLGDSNIHTDPEDDPDDDPWDDPEDDPGDDPDDYEDELEYEINVPEKYNIYDLDEDLISIEFYNCGNGGNITISVDGINKSYKVYHNYDVDLTARNLGLKSLEYKDYTIDVLYSGDDQFEGFEEHYTFTGNYGFNIWESTLEYEDGLKWGTDIDFEVTLPEDAKGNLTYEINGKKYSILAEDIWNIEITSDKLDIGENEIIFSYVGDDYPLDCINYNFNVYIPIKISNHEIAFNESTSISLNMPSDAIGNLSVYEVTFGEDEYDEPYIESCTLIGTAHVENGFANVTLSNLEIGEHYIYANYTGTDYEAHLGELSDDYWDWDRKIYVNPIINVPSKISEDASNVMTLIFPEGYEGSLTIIIGDEERDVNIENGIASFELFNLESAEEDIDGQVLNVEIQLDSNSIYESIPLTSTPRTPDLNLTLKVDEILKGDEYPFVDLGNVPDDADGYVKVSIDGKVVIKKTYELNHFDDDLDFSSLDYGIHTIKIDFRGDSYYNPTSVNATFEVVDVIIDIPDEVGVGTYSNYIDSYTIGSIRTIYEDGYYTLTIDGNVVDMGFPFKDKVINTDMGSKQINLTRGSHDVILTYTRGDMVKSLSKTINAVYYLNSYMRINGDEYAYEIYEGDNITFIFEAPIDVIGNLKVKVDSTPYTIPIVNGTARLTLGNLNAGEHTYTIKYDGDEYPEFNMDDDFTVEKREFGIISNYNENNYNEGLKYGDDLIITAYLPDGFNGKLIVCNVIDNINYPIKTINIINSNKATYTISNLSYGNHEIYAEIMDYDTDLYDWFDDTLEIQFDVMPAINGQASKINEYFRYGENNSMTANIELPSDANGILYVDKVDYNNEETVLATYEFNVVNGNSTVLLNNLTLGDNKFYLRYNDGKYNLSQELGTITLDPLIEYNQEINMGDDEYITVHAPDGVVSAFGLNATVVDGVARIPISGLPEGQQFITNLVVKTEDYTYRYYSGGGVQPKWIDVRKPKPSFSISETSNPLTIELNKDATGDIIIEVGNQSYAKPLVNGKATINDLNVASNEDILLWYVGNDQYGQFRKYVKLGYVYVSNLTKQDTYTVVSTSTANLYLGDSISLSASIYRQNYQALAGTVHFYVNNKLVSIGEDGSYIPKEVGLYTVEARYNGTSMYYPSSDAKTFIVLPAIPQAMNSNENGIIEIMLPINATGTLTVYVDDKIAEEFDVEEVMNKFLSQTQGDVSKIIMGILRIDLSKYNGQHTIVFVYSGDDTYDGFRKESVVTVKIPSISAGNMNVLYTAGQKYTIRVFSDAGVLANGASVVVKANGKTFKTLQAVNGLASFQVTQVPGTYKLTITSLGKTITKTLTVTHLVTLKTAKVKKSAKKLVLQATLKKVNGKYLKNKKITFKFNGKKYTAKTNKKGVAKVTIKANVLKKLKAGKKVTYQATYLKDTVKKTAKVKK